MKLLYKLLLTFLLAVLMQAVNAQTNCCNAGFSSSHLSQSRGLNTFQFLMSDSSASDIQSVQWTFGDGTYSNSKLPIHSYNYTGNYSVTLTVFKSMVDSVQKSCTETRVLSVTSSCSNFIYFKSNKAVSFIQTAAFDVDSSSSWAQSRNFVWAFGDGQTSNELNPTHTYAQNGNYTACLYQYRNDSAFVDSCYTCQTVSIQDTTSTVCNANFSYNVTGVNVSVHAADSVNMSYWWALGDTGTYYGSNAYFTITSNGGLTICHRKYSGAASPDSVQYCEDCTTIYSDTPIDTIPVICNADFIYALTDSIITLDDFDSTRISYWSYSVNGVSANFNDFDHDTSFVVPSKGELVICHFLYNDGTYDSCVVCKTVREHQDTIPQVCYSDFGYTVNGLTVTAHVDSISYGRNVWHFANKPAVYDTLLVSHTFNAPGVKRICQTTFTTSSLDSCTTCKDVLVEEANVTIHPNPATTHIMVKSNEGLISSIGIYDINGLVVKNISEINGVKYNVNVSDLTSGIYYVSIVLEDGRVNRSKIIKQ